MNERVIVIEQRLRSRGLVVVLALVIVAFVGVSASIFASTSSSSISPVALAIDVVVFVGLVVALFFFLRVTVRVVETSQGRSLEVVYGPLGLVRQVFGPDALVAAYARDFSLLQMGGWGYQGSVRLLRRAALVTRRGDALGVQLRGKRRFAVTVDGPADFVTALAIRALAETLGTGEGETHGRRW